MSSSLFLDVLTRFINVFHKINLQSIIAWLSLNLTAS